MWKICSYGDYKYAKNLTEKWLQIRQKFDRKVVLNMPKIYWTRDDLETEICQFRSFKKRKLLKNNLI